MAMSLIVTSMSAFAQNNGKPEYPRYGFWSNWSIGASIDLNNQPVMGGFNFGDNWRVSTNTGMSIFAQQKLNHAFDWRLRFGFPSFGDFSTVARTATIEFLDPYRAQKRIRKPWIATPPLLWTCCSR